jgi:hypothetical protein
MLANYDESQQEIYPPIRGYGCQGHYPMKSLGIGGKLRINFAPPLAAS